MNEKERTYVTLEPLHHRKARLLWAGRFLCEIDETEAKNILKLISTFLGKVLSEKKYSV